jgi:hypothetical protein
MALQLKQIRGVNDIPQIQVQGAQGEAPINYRPGMLTVPADDANKADIRGSLQSLVRAVNQGAIVADAANVVNKTGLGSQIHRNERLEEAMRSPEQYVIKRNNRLVLAAEKLESTYFNTFNSMFAKGMSKEQADAIATSTAQAEADFELAQINLDYPTDIIQNSLAAAQNLTAARRGAAAAMIAAAP